MKYILGSRKVYDRMEEMLMTDIVEELREQSRVYSAPHLSPEWRAAAEIERLRGILAETVPDPEYRRMQDREIERLRSLMKGKK